MAKARGVQARQPERHRGDPAGRQGRCAAPGGDRAERRAACAGPGAGGRGHPGRRRDQPPGDRGRAQRPRHAHPPRRAVARLDGDEPARPARAAGGGMRQSRLMSLVEAVANVVVGYGVAVLVQIAVFPVFGLSVTFGRTSDRPGLHRGLDRAELPAAAAVRCLAVGRPTAPIVLADDPENPGAPLFPSSTERERSLFVRHLQNSRPPPITGAKLWRRKLRSAVHGRRVPLWRAEGPRREHIPASRSRSMARASVVAAQASIVATTVIPTTCANCNHDRQNEPAAPSSQPNTLATCLLERSHLDWLSSTLCARAATHSALVPEPSISPQRYPRGYRNSAAPDPAGRMASLRVLIASSWSFSSISRLAW